MNNSARSACYLVAPCLALGAFAVFLSRHSHPPLPSVLYGPLKFSIQGVEVQKMRPINVYEGYDHRFQMVWQATGTRPKWWGQAIDSRSGTEIKNWKFWLERDGKRTPFKPSKTEIWTTDWDKTNKRYSNAFSLHCGAIPTNASLKASGIASLDLTKSPTPFKASSPFEITLKKAGEQWTRPQVSTDPHLVIRKIEIRRPRWGRTVAAVTLFSRSGSDLNASFLGWAQILTADWRFCPAPSGTFEMSFGGDSNLIRKPSERIGVVEFQWVDAQVRKTPQRDLIVSGIYGNSEDWPLEIAFAIKKNGKSVFGVVPALTRPPAR